MHSTMPAQPRISRISKAWKLLPCRTQVLLAAMMALGAMSAFADQHATQKTTAQKPPAITQKPSARAHKRIAAGKTATPAAQTAPALAADTTPKPPDWPANDHPAEATVVWNSHGLRIDAANSSLLQILKDVAAATGAKVEGMGADQRIFGAYGPGPAREVLSQLLDGSGYNVLMIGDRGQGTPRQIVLSAQPKGPAPPATNNPNLGSNDNADADEPAPEPQPTQPPNIRNGFNPGMPPRTPQQIMQEMQQRQQQIEQMQQQQHNNPQ